MNSLGIGYFTTVEDGRVHLYRIVRDARGKAVGCEYHGEGNGDPNDAQHWQDAGASPNLPADVSAAVLTRWMQDAKADRLRQAKQGC